MPENLPSKRESEPEIIEPEIVGLKPPPLPWWRRLLARAAFAVFLAVFGTVLALIGVILTLTIVGAAFGIPLIIIGLLTFVAGLALPLLNSKIKVVTFRWPPR